MNALDQLVNLARLRGYYWNGRLGQYISKWNNQPVLEATVLKRIETYQSVVARNVEGITDDFIANKLDLASWQRAMAKEVKDSRIIGAIVGRGGRAQMTQADWGRVGARLREEYRFLNDFALEIKAGNLSEAQIVARANRYSNSIRSSYYDGLTAAKADSEFTQERRFLDPAAAHCTDCLDYADAGWVSIGVLPPPGERCACNRNCRCVKEFRKQETVIEDSLIAPQFKNTDEAKKYFNNLNISTDFRGATLEQIQAVANSHASFSNRLAFRVPVDNIRFVDDVSYVGRWQGHQNTILVNQSSYKNSIVDWRVEIARSQKHIGRLERRLVTYGSEMTTEEIAYVNERIDYYKNRSFIRSSVSENIEDVFTHEIAHGVNDDLVYGENKGLIRGIGTPEDLRKQGVSTKNSWDNKLWRLARSEKGLALSEYATTNDSEYWAEAFTAFLKGEGHLVDNELIKVFERLTK